MGEAARFGGEEMAQKDERVRKNLVSSLIYQVVLISISFLLPRLYLENFGSEINGVLSTIKQIFAYMWLLEAGVGLATTQALYKRLGEEDYKGAGSVLSATKLYYLKTGFVYLGIVLLIAVLYAYFIPTGITGHVVFLLVFLNAVPGLFSYFVYAKYRVLMEADGRKYIINNSETVVQLLSNLGKVLVLFLTDSLILIQLVYCVIALCQLIFLYIYAKKRYTWLDFSLPPDFKAISQKNSVIAHQLSGMVFSNTDVILISVMCDFKAVSIYTIYNIFFSQMQNLITSIVSGVNFKFGQMFYADRERFYKAYDIYEKLYIMATFVIYTLMAVFLLPLIQLYTKGINDADYTNETLLILFVIMNLLANTKMPSGNVIEYSGEFSQTRSHAIWEMAINLTVSVAAIYYIGIIGAIIGTVAALIYRNIVAVYHVNKKVIKRSVFATYKSFLINGGVFLFVMLVFFVNSFSNISFIRLVLKGIIHSVWITALYIIANLIFNKSLYTAIIEFFRGKKKHEYS